MLVGGFVGMAVAVLVVVLALALNQSRVTGPAPLRQSGAGSAGSGPPPQPQAAAVGPGASDAIASNGLPAWAASCPPPGTTEILYINFDRIRRSPLWPILTKQVAANPMAKALESADAQAISELFMFHVGINPGGFVVRTRDDLAIDRFGDLMLRLGGAPANLRSLHPERFRKRTYKGVEYLGTGSDLGPARLAPRMYLIVRREEDLKLIADRRARNEASPLDEGLRQAARYCRGDLSLAIRAPADFIPAFARGGGLSGPTPQVRWGALTLTYDAQITVLASAGFDTSTGASWVRQEFERLVQEMDRKAASAPADQRAVLAQRAALLQRIRPVQRETDLELHVALAAEDVERLIADPPFGRGWFD